MKRGLAIYSPMLATALLTAAIFLLPTSADRRQARAAFDDIKLSATHIEYEEATGISVARE